MSRFSKRKARQILTRIQLAESELNRLKEQITDSPSSDGPEEGEPDGTEERGSGSDPTSDEALPRVNACRNQLEVALDAIGRKKGDWDKSRAGYEDVGSAYQALYAARRELIFLRWYAGTRPNRHDGGRKTTPDGGTVPSSGDPFVRREATKVLTRAKSELSGWSLFVILKMLTADGSQARRDLDIDTVIEAQQIHDEQALKRIEMVDVLERQHLIFMLGAGLSSIAIVLLASVAPFFVFSSTFDFFGTLSMRYGATALVAVALFGLLGASISGLITLRGVSPSARMPLGTVDLKMLAYARLATGVGSALALVMLVESGVPEGILVGGEQLKIPAMVLVVAFVAGFSERLLTRAMAKVAGEEESSLSDISAMLRYENQSKSPSPEGGETPPKSSAD